jgi:Flp pilus assembly pilin Flp
MRETSGRGFSIVEYTVLLLVIASAFAISWQYVQNGIQGQFRRAGSGFAFSRQHEPQRTRDCIWDDRLVLWYSEKCFTYYGERRHPLSDDVLKTMYCREHLTPTACVPTGDESYRSVCPSTCRWADIKTFNCSAPCAALANP